MEIMRTYRKWTEDEIELLRNNINKLSSYEIALALHRTEYSVTGMKKILGLNISHEFFQSLCPGRKGSDSPRWRGGQLETTRRYIAGHLEGKRAKDTVYYYVANGGLKRLSCKVCGTTIGVQAHHDDYNKPLDVIWLCRKHHRNLHRAIGGRKCK